MDINSRYSNCPGYHSEVLGSAFQGLKKLKSALSSCYKLPIYFQQKESLCWVIPELKHTKFTWFGNLPTPRSYWFVLIKLRNNTNNNTRRRRKSSLLNSTLSSSLSVFLSISSSPYSSHSLLTSSSLSIHIY